MKNLQFPEQDYQQLVALARQVGFRVSRGRGSQLRLFVMAAANKCVQSDTKACEQTFHQLMKLQGKSFCCDCGVRL